MLTHYRYIYTCIGSDQTDRRQQRTKEEEKQQGSQSLAQHKKKRENAAGKLKGIIKESTAGQSYIDTRNGDSLHWSPISKESYSGSITEKKIYIYCILYIPKAATAAAMARVSHHATRRDRFRRARCLMIPRPIATLRVSQDGPLPIGVDATFP